MPGAAPAAIVRLTLQSEGFLQPYLLIENERERPTRDGSSALGYLKHAEGLGFRLAPIADLYEIDEVDDAQLDRDEREIARPFEKGMIAWKACELTTDGPKRQLMTPGAYTELFFLDEATALAAGHRPCAQCRHKRYTEFLDAWCRGNSTITGGKTPSAVEMDCVLHGERLDANDQRITFQANLDDLTDGTFVLWPPEKASVPVLVLGEHLLVWTPAGYGPIARSRPKGAMVSVITPRSIVNAMSGGYRLDDLPKAPTTVVSEEVVRELVTNNPALTGSRYLGRGNGFLFHDDGGTGGRRQCGLHHVQRSYRWRAERCVFEQFC